LEDLNGAIRNRTFKNKYDTMAKSKGTKQKAPKKQNKQTIGRQNTTQKRTSLKRR